MNILLLLFAFLPHNFHGCAVAPDGMHGWAVTLDTVPLDTLSIIHTSNGGMDWEKQVNPLERQFFDVTCIDSNRAWICGVGGIILGTDDGGETWNIESDGHTKYYARIQLLDTLHGYAAGGDGVFGRKEGAIWQRVFTQWYQTDFYGVAFADTLNGWMCGRPSPEAGGEASHIVHTTEGGSSWELQVEDSVYDFLDICFIGGKYGWVVGGKDSTYEPLILHTADAGQHWDEQTNIEGGYYLRSVEFPDRYNGWACGMFGTILKTTDGGESWFSQPNPADSTIFDIELVDPFRGIAVGNGILLYRIEIARAWQEWVLGIEENNNIFSGFTISPNPFNEKTVISYSIGSCGQLSVIGDQPITDYRSPITFTIYDLSGRLIRRFTIYDLRFTSVVWDGRDDRGNSVPTGTYMCVLDGGEVKLKQKIVKIR
ncbi:hypothetical protein CH333_05850 [candidate division WOR-3 bacterium JGI_Cruoil_03_44_89]|uniref:Photosynthesis system II assembly factor Ycf48/Hcf136-like domain-containing protein n=1 Tax=candidate division WOR-3 bacterium JGI_Cruoil_03_44_89 TaxID=1973748 RepID=A0A235BSE7_UNCW3|nr:MAG: hypothetical protein CH333_05850 [candidate division WOR-3 bacterium JGI_Cruoil_03_44_89]